MMLWCGEHRIRYSAENEECPLCASSTVDDVEGPRGTEA